MDTSARSPDTPIEVLVISDVRLYRDGILELLDDAPCLRAGGSPGALGDVLAAVERARPDVALVDAATAGSREAVRFLGLTAPRAAVILLTVSEGNGALRRFSAARIAGHVTLDASRTDLVEAIDRALQQRAPAPPIRPCAAEAGLTAREVEILRLLEEGLSNKEIAKRLFIGVPTVKSHVHNILRKLGAARRGQAAARARAAV